MLITYPRYTSEEKATIQGLVEELVTFVQRRHDQALPITLTDFSRREGKPGEMQDAAERLLQALRVPRLCSSDTLWLVFDLLENACGFGPDLISEAMRRHLLSGVGAELDTQERALANRVQGMVLVIDKARRLVEAEEDEGPDDGESIPGEADPVDTEAREHLLSQAHWAKKRLLEFMAEHPSLLTFGVQSVLAEADDPDIPLALVQATDGRVEYMTQVGIIEWQGRQRQVSILGVLRGLNEAALRAIQGLNAALLDSLGLIETGPDLQAGGIADVRRGVERRAAAAVSDFNHHHKEAVVRLRARSEATIERHAPRTVLALVDQGALAAGLEGEVIKIESRLHNHVDILVQGLVARRDELRAGWPFVENKARDLLSREAERLDLELQRLRGQLDDARQAWETDVLREDHHRASMERLEKSLERLDRDRGAYAEAQQAIMGRLKDLAASQFNLMDRFIGQMQTLQARTKAQTKLLFGRLINPQLSGERQHEIIRFGDRELIDQVLRTFGRELAPEAQMALAMSGDRDLQERLVRTVGERLVMYARQYISPELLLATFERTDLMAGVRY